MEMISLTGKTNFLKKRWGEHKKSEHRHISESQVFSTTTEF